ncbi:MAG: 2-succinyl-5-enolpyruvyl-6-hydroxy-3-cyclohexene-1-carboxylic-acid synthase [Muricauda sp.]|nr:2-succinyl-5-enolpyruvyl-6-hydroxy-3-cyclohexene-1-carboxylic-acid synthase [Allomuricauda sp.]MAU26124.1 2-succinyl-5-enolpyruvyl-6-hydroxy-3-cyclohexene-1-carboxylic-acid synthase [Allomuricauda sp.]MBC30926.1 2-succinyl-5-enolpyruvyl-6-hydroxy-3-cyclohexene-1-carboxylic-acid synthase [Allomuricauda sp.]
MNYSKIPSAQTAVVYCKAFGIKNIVISPGSRNAPLILGFNGDDFFKCYSVVDERCAGFFALGMAQQLNGPVAVVCTSGSALLNYHPAVAEAFYSQIPLVVISADRPTYKIDIGDGQTIRQENVLEKHIGYSANLKQDVNHAVKAIEHMAPQLLEQSQQAIEQFNAGEVNKALGVAVSKKLPVHINVPFEEPLYQTVQQPTIGAVKAQFDREISKNDFSELLTTWHGAKRKLVLVGTNPPADIEQKYLNRLGEDASVAVLTETTSNLHHGQFFPSIDSIIAPIEKIENSEAVFEALKPEVLVTFGGLVVSKKIKAFLRKYRPKYHYHIGQNRANDTFFALTGHYKASPKDFLKVLYNEKNAMQSDYRDAWMAYKKRYEKGRREYLGQIPFCDFKAFAMIMETIPATYQVHFANSSAIRYAQLFNVDASLKVFCNRGTSGIEGSTSTAIGASVYASTPTLLVTGDLSFFYDSNALWNNYIRHDFRIIVVNNSGGGIFRILPGAENTEQFATYFETRHAQTAQQLCEMFNFGYSRANDGESLAKQLAHFYQNSDRPKLLEIFTPVELNDKVLLGYFEYLRKR